MKLRHCASLLLSLGAFEKASCNDYPAINPLIGRDGSSLDFIPLPGRGNQERQHFTITEPLLLFPLAPGEVTTDRKRGGVTLAEEDFISKRPRPINTDTHCADFYANDERQLKSDPPLSAVPFAPGAGTGSQKRVQETLADEGHVLNVLKRPEPVTTGTRNVPPQVNHIATGAGVDSREQIQAIFSPEWRPRNYWYHHHIFADNRWKPPPSASRGFMSSTTPFDKTRLDLPNHEEASPVSRNNPPTTAPTHFIAETPPSNSEKTLLLPHVDSPSVPMRKREKEFWNELSERTLEWTPPM
ncbi:hypothetical protein PtB15_13B513 [Puccinia triticina]|nr:hypothetical protein PtB15_13B513 [Puccinia triticina]